MTQEQDLNSDLYLKQLELGPMQNFVYLLGSRQKRECVVVDPAWDLAAIQRAAAEDDMKITAALVTHYHPDHCGGHRWGFAVEGVAELVGACSIPVYANKHEVEGLCQVTGLSRTDVRASDSGDILTVGDVSISMIHTPGHTPGSQCFLVRGNLVAGDTLFLTGCGRVDLPGGDPEEMYRSLHERIGRLPSETMIYPGHHYDPEGHLALAEVRRRNPYLQASDLKQWLSMRGV